MTAQMIELAAARAVHRARLLERAVHDRGPWEIEIGGIREDAFHVVCPNRVVLISTFPGVCWLEPPTTIDLYCSGELVDSKPFETPIDGAFRVNWELVAEESAAYV